MTGHLKYSIDTTLLIDLCVGYIPYHRNSKSLAMKNAGMAPKEKRKKEKITIHFPGKVQLDVRICLIFPKISITHSERTVHTAYIRVD
jgi:hypothetical protein